MDISKLDQKIKPSGTMAISNKSRELKSQGKPVIGFGAGEPDFPSPDYVVDAAIKAAADPKNHKYSPAAGLESLRQIIAKTTKGSGVSFIENQINWHHKVPSEDEYRRAISELNEKLNSYE